MKRHTTKATMAIMFATALHAIATGNMLPAFVTEADGSLRFNAEPGLGVAARRLARLLRP